MATLDRINVSMGRGNVRLARVPAQGGWAMKQELRSPGYTSRGGVADGALTLPINPVHCWAVERLEVSIQAVLAVEEQQPVQREQGDS